MRFKCGNPRVLKSYMIILRAQTAAHLLIDRSNLHLVFDCSPIPKDNSHSFRTGARYYFTNEICNYVDFAFWKMYCLPCLRQHCSAIRAEESCIWGTLKCALSAMHPAGVIRLIPYPMSRHVGLVWQHLPMTWFQSFVTLRKWEISSSTK